MHYSVTTRIMKPKMLPLLCLFLLGSVVSSCAEEERPVTPALDLGETPFLPIPRYVRPDPGSFGLDSTVRVLVQTGTGRDSLLRAELLGFLFRRTGWDLGGNVQKDRYDLLFWKKSPVDRYLGLRLNDTLMPGQPEGYLLRIFQDSILLESNSELGLLRGLQTFKQLFPIQPNDTLAEYSIYTIPTGTIRDYPEWGYRGIMLDVSRHFFEPEEMKGLIDQLAFYKMNRLHLHLSDDQGWRLEIHSWPKLSQVGGSKEVGGTPGGFFTQEEFADLVEYADRKGILLIPEFDMPGHTQAAIASYPFLNGTNRPPELYTGTRVGFSSLATRKEVVYQFVDSLFSELKPLIGNAPIHIGGDESEATSASDYIYFMNRVKKMADGRGIRLMGWEDIAVADIDSTTTVQYWRGRKLPERALDKGAKLVLSPAWNAYLDMKYSEDSRYGLTWAGYIPLDSAYSWRPEEEFPDHRRSVLGIEAPLWSETISNPDEMEYLAFPRLLAYAELGWAPPENRDLHTFRERLAGIQRFLDEDGIDYYRSPSVNWKD